MKDFNFFSSYIKVRKNSKIKNTYVLVTATSLALFFGGTFYWSNTTINSVKEDIQQMEEYLQSNKVLEDVQELNEKKRKIDIMSMYYDLALKVNRKITKVDRLGTDVLSKISDSLPEDISFKMISMDIENIQIEGMSENRVSIAELQYNLKETGLFQQVHVIEIAKESNETDSYVFALKCTLKDVK